MYGRKRLCLLLVALLQPSCGDRPTAPAAPPVTAPPPAALAPPPAYPAMAATLDCAVEVASGKMSCGASSTGGARAQSGPVTVGGQGEYVTLAGTGTYDAGTGIFTVPVTVRNLIPQPLGTTDGTTADASGVRVFFIRITPVGGAMSVRNADGTGTFTGAGQSYFQYAGLLAQNTTSAPRTWQLDMAPTVTSFTFRVGVWAQVRYRVGWIDLSPASPVLAVGSTVTLTPTKRDVVGRDSGSANVTWGSSDPTRATVNGSGVVTGVAAGTAVITASGTLAEQPISGSTTVTVAVAPVAHDETYPQTVIGHVPINSARIPFSVTTNDQGSPLTVAGYGWNAAVDDHLTSAGGAVVMTTSGADIGKFSYTPPVGFTGTDQFKYRISNALGSSTATVSLAVSGVVWFINSAGSNGDGRLGTPFNNLASFASINDGVGNHPAAGDFVFLYGSGSSYTGNLTLLGTQRVVGQNASSSLATLLGLPSLPTGSDALPAMASSPVSRMTGALTLGSGNSLVGLTLGSVTGNSFGTLTVADAKVEAGAAQALDLTTGTANGAFISITSTGGTNGIKLSGVAGTVTVTGSGTAGSGGTLSGHTGAAVSLASGSSASLARMSIANNGGYDGVNYNGADSLTLSSNTFTTSGPTYGGGIRLIAGTGTSTVRILNNTFTDVKATGASDQMNFMQGPTAGALRATITGNTFSNARLSGDGLYLETNGDTRLNLSNNTYNGPEMITAYAPAGTISLLLNANNVTYRSYGLVPLGYGAAVCLAAASNTFTKSGVSARYDLDLAQDGGSMVYEGVGVNPVTTAYIQGRQNSSTAVRIAGVVNYTAIGSCLSP